MKAAVRAAKVHAPRALRQGVALRAMHSLGGGAGWGDEVTLAGVAIIVAGFVLWGLWQRRKGRA